MNSLKLIYFLSFILLAFSNPATGQDYNLDSIVIDYPYLKKLYKPVSTKKVNITPYGSDDLADLEFLDEELKKYPKGLLEDYNVHVYLVNSIEERHGLQI